MSTTLALDTSTVVAVGVAVDGRIVGSGRVEDSRAHAEQLMPLVQRVLAEAGITLADVDQIVAGVRSSCTYAGAASLEEFRSRALVGVQSTAGYAEGRPLHTSW